MSNATRFTISSSLFFLFLQINLQAQSYWSELNAMPEAVTNNALTSAKIGDNSYVYSFAGMDSTKIWSGIHLKSWKYDVQNNNWTSLAPIPDPEGGKIAAAASSVKNKIYLIGGYHVAQNGAETSSNKVHRFDPASNNWLSDGANIPVAIDDQVQAVWRDSLIYVITGWSNTSNVPVIQIYNPTENQWITGTSVPNSNNYKAFGASGVIVDDTIFYCGGATTAANFPAATNFRKGAINPLNPKQITWSQVSTPLAKGYRMGCATMSGFPIWIGGSSVTYNYDGIAYDGSGGVSPSKRILVYNRYVYALEEIFGEMPSTMDLRGAAQIDIGSVIVAGGMVEDQKVTNRVWALSFAFLTKNEDILPENSLFYPNPCKDLVQIKMESVAEIRVFDELGRLYFSKTGADLSEFSMKELAYGVYFLEIKTKENRVFREKIVKE
jgi:hypothetical protein